MESLLGSTSQQVQSWKQQMHKYQKGKRTKKPFGKQLSKVEKVTYADVKEKQTRFHPIIQKYQKEQDELAHAQKEDLGRVKSLISHLKTTAKYQKQYDIINLYGQPSHQPPHNKKLGPIRNIYDVINNQKIPQYMYQGRQLKLPQQHQRVILEPPRRQYDTVTGIYKHNNEERQRQELSKKDQQILDKYWKTHDYDVVTGKFYNNHKQQLYQKQLAIKMEQHGKDYQKRLPPSYVQRQPYIPDYTKPIPDSLKLFDERKENAKKRFKIKYIVESQYEKRNGEQEQKRQQIIKNRVHNSKVLEEKQKQFDIITTKKYQPTRAEQLYNKKILSSTWDKLNPKIKSSAFQISH